MRDIVITLEGGLIQSIQGIPKGVRIIVLDFDTEGSRPEDDDRIAEIKLGEFAFVSTWDANDLLTPMEPELVDKIKKAADRYDGRFEAK